MKHSAGAAKLADIAKAAGVSPAVVSRVVNRDPGLRISAVTRERVQTAIRESGYSPNFVARSLRFSQTGIVAIILNDMANPVYAEIVRGAQAAAGQAKKALLIGDLSCGPEHAAHLADVISGRGVDGLIIQPAGGDNEDLLASAARLNLPAAQLQTRLDPGAHLVSLPDEQAAGLAASQLLACGHRKIGCIATRYGLTFTMRRLRGLRKTLLRAGLEAEDCPVEFAGSTAAEGSRAAGRLLQLPGITALICFNVLAAIGSMHQAIRLGKAVPDDLSVIALHDTDLAAHLNPPLTTVAMPLFEMGRSAVEYVCGTRPHSSDETKVLSPPRLVIRASVAPP